MKRSAVLAFSLLILFYSVRPAGAVRENVSEYPGATGEKSRAASRLLEEGHPAEAVAGFREALEACPGHRPSLEGLARAHLALSEYEEALDIARRMSAGGQAPAETARLLATIQAVLEAEREVIRAIAEKVRAQAAETRRLAKEARPRLLRDHARLLRDAGRFREALTFYEEAVIAAPPGEERRSYRDDYRSMASEIEKAGRERKFISRAEARLLVERIELFFREYDPPEAVSETPRPAPNDG